MSDLSPHQAYPYVVVCGSSAGGARVIKTLVSSLNLKRGLSLVVVQHMGEAGGRLARDFLAGSNEFPVIEIRDGIELLAGQVYFVPAQHSASLSNGKFYIWPAVGATEKLSVIDQTFSSLSRELKKKLIGIVMSGEHKDGTEGIITISNDEGLTIVQNPNSADHPSMPCHAINSGFAHHILNPDKISDAVHSYVDKLIANEPKEMDLESQVLTALPNICEIVEKHTKHDFLHYKSTTIVRRIRRRLQVLNMSSVGNYIQHLEASKEEVNALFTELLINVTSFFRDQESFEYLRQEILEKTLATHSFEKYRIWVAGCSTGEEVYTVGILLSEALEKVGRKIQLQILATDIDDHALSQARKGSYPSSIASQVSESRLQRFFTKRNGRYEVVKELRDMCLFSSHNLVKDPPFSQVDLILCRNVLIYLGPHLQKKLVPVFHYALRPGGHLFLGTSESLTLHTDLFRPVSAKHRISQKKENVTRSPTPPYQNFSVPSSKIGSDTTMINDADLHTISQRIILSEYAPRYVLINDEGQILSMSSDINQYMELAEGAFQNNILKLVKASLRVSIRSTLYEARQSKQKVTHPAVAVKLGDQYQRIEVTVQPVPRTGNEPGVYIVVFRDLGTLNGRSENLGVDDQAANESLIHELESELFTLRADLDKSVQDLEASNEELKSSNEELLSMNEELQSANEELETSKEDVQEANLALQRANSDLENSLTSTRIATLFLDDSLQIKSFTPAIEAIYDLRPHDIGRSISRFVSYAPDMPQYPNSSQVQDSEPVEHEVVLGSKVYLRRILPYRNHEGKREGLVVAFIDVTELRRSEERLQVALESARMGSWQLDLRTNVVKASPKANEIVGADLSEADLNETMRKFTHPDDIELVEQRLQESISQRIAYSVEYRLVRPNQEIRWVHARGQATYTESGEPEALTGVLTDITEQKLAAQKLATSESKFRTLAASIPQLAWMAEPNGEIFWYNQRWYDYTGSSFEKMQGWGWTAAHHPADLSRIISEVQEHWRKGEAWENTYLIRKHTGEYRWFLTRAEPIRDASGKIIKWIGTNTDVDDQQRAREIIARQGEEFRLITEAIPQPIWRASLDGQADYFSENFTSYVGYSSEQLTGKGWIDIIHPDDQEKVTSTWTRFTERGLRVAVDFRVVRSDGSLRWYLLLANPFIDERGEINSYYGTWTDIHEQKKAIEDLHFQNQLTQTITDNAASCLFMMDKSGHPTFMNPAAQKLTGYVLDDIKHRPLHYAVHYRKPDGSHYPMEECPIDNAQAELQNLREQEETFVDKHGRLYPVSYSISPLERNNEIVGSVLEFRDISTQKKIESDLNETIETLEYLSSVGQALSAELDLDKVVSLVTESARKVSKAAFGAFFYNVYNADGGSYTLYTIAGVPKEEFDKFPMPRKTAIFAPTFDGTGIVRSDDITKDPRYGLGPTKGMPEGHLAVCSYLAIPVISSSGRVLGGLFFGHPEPGVFTDKEENLVAGLAAHAAVAIDNVQLYRETQNAIKARDEFLTIASHELKTPITSLKLQMQILARQIQKGDKEALLPENLVQMAETSIRQTKQLTSLIDDMLDVARIETGRMEFDFENIDLTVLLKDSFAAFSSQLKDAGVAASMKCDETLPVKVDSFRLEQVLTNLFSNALKYGGGKPIEVRAWKHEDHAVIEVMDNGIGVGEEHLSKIFKRFERAISPKGITGLGLGLFISRQIVEAHGGTIGVQSVLGKGSTFTVKIPLAMN